MNKKELYNCLESCPIVASVHDISFENVLKSPAEVIFLLGGNILTVGDRIEAAHKAGKSIFIHIDLTDGIGKDRSGVQYLASIGADGILSTKAILIRIAKECGLLTVQRFFAYDTQGIESISEILANSSPDIVEIMPGVIGKIIERFSKNEVPLIAGGLIETKLEVTTALSLGPLAVSTGVEDLWYI